MFYVENGRLLLSGGMYRGFQKSYSKNSFWSFICNVSTIFWAVKTRKVGLTPTHPLNDIQMTKLYGTSPAIRGHTMSPATSTSETERAPPNPRPQAGRPTRFTYHGGMEGWVDLGFPTIHRPGVELATCRSQVRRSNHYTTTTVTETVSAL